MLINEKIPVIIYAGEFDLKDGATVQEQWIRQIRFKAEDTFWASHRLVYWVPYGDAYINGGLYRSDKYFTFLTVPKAGHFVPANNYRVSFQILSDFIQDHRLIRHNEYVATPAKAMCESMRYCGNKGVCTIEGQCICDEGYKFADCS